MSGGIAANKESSWSHKDWKINLSGKIAGANRLRGSNIDAN